MSEGAQKDLWEMVLNFVSIINMIHEKGRYEG